MATYIALDGGGTKTLTVVFEETGHILYRSHTAGSNPLDIGPDASRQLSASSHPGHMHHVHGQNAGSCSLSGICAVEAE